MSEPEKEQWNLRKGEKGKDGMILLLTGQVDIKKQEVRQKTEQLRCREEEVEHLQSTVQQLQSTIKGSDGSITLLKYQLAAARVSDSHNASMLLPQPSHSGVSPDRQSLLLHWKRSRPVLKDILGRERPFPAKYQIVESKNNTEVGIGSISNDVMDSSTVVQCNCSPPAADNLSQRLVVQEQQNKQLQEQIVSWMALMQHHIVGLEVVTKTTKPISSEPTSSSKLTNEKDMVHDPPCSSTAPSLLFRSPMKEETDKGENGNLISDTATASQIKEKNICSSTSSSSPSPRIVQSLFNGLRRSSPIAAVINAGTPTTESKQQLQSSPTVPLSVPLSTLLNDSDDDDDNMPLVKDQPSSSPSPMPLCSEQQQQQQPVRQRSMDTRATFDASSSSPTLLQTVLTTPIKASVAAIGVNGSSGGMEAFAVSTPGGSNVTFSATMDRIRRIKQKAAEAHSSLDKNKSTSIAANRLVVKDCGGGDGPTKVSPTTSKSDVPPIQVLADKRDLSLVPSAASSSSSETVNIVGLATYTNSVQHLKVGGTAVEPMVYANTPSKTLSRLLGGGASPTTTRPLGNGNSQDNDKENNAPLQSQAHHHRDGVALNTTALSPEQFSNEVVRLKHENGSIRDDILRFRSTLQRLREECQATATAVTNTGGHAAAAFSGRSDNMDGKGRDATTDAVATTLPPNDHHRHHRPHYSQLYSTSREDAAAALSSSSSLLSCLPRVDPAVSISNSHVHRINSSSSCATSSSRTESFMLGATNNRRPPLSTSSLASYPMHPPVMPAPSSSSSSLSSTTSTRPYFENNYSNSGINKCNNLVSDRSLGEQCVGDEKGGVYLQYQSLQSFSTARRSVPLPPTHTTQHQPVKQQPLLQQQQKGLYGMPPAHKVDSRLALSSNSLTFADIDPTMIW